ncbi:MAG: AtpZ/AtpI family protein [Dehalococcoidales bacterium]|nr:AtpZ/AtpI family protein [Dehalococcoidales bacterium]
MNKWGMGLRVTGVGFYVGGSVILGVFGGRWLDTKLDITPVGVIAGLLLGLVVAFYGVWKMLAPFIGKKKDKESV